MRGVFEVILITAMFLLDNPFLVRAIYLFKLASLTADISN